MKLILNEILQHKGEFEKEELQELMKRCHTRNISVYTLETLLNFSSVPLNSMEEDLSAFVPSAATITVDIPPKPGSSSKEGDIDLLKKQVNRWRLMALLLGLMLIVLLLVFVPIA